MAWNRSDSQSVMMSRRGLKVASHAKRKLKIAIVIVAIISGSLVCIFLGKNAYDADIRVDRNSGKGQAGKEAKERMRKIIEHKTKTTFIPTSLPKKDAECFGWYTNKAGEVKRRTGKQFVISMGSTKEIFANRAEQQLSALVNTPLGSNYYDYDVPEDFEDTFAHSLTNVIKICDDDPPDVIRKKERVIEAKENLRKLWKAGVDIKQVVQEEKLAMKKKFEDYIFFEQGLNELRANEATADEIADYALAAKTLMKQHEIEEPLLLNDDEFNAMDKIESLISGKQKDNASNTQEEANYE